MEVDGAVLCHIMNLYSSSLNPERYWGRSAGRVPSYASKESCVLPFGRLAWTKTGGEIHAHFEPGPKKNSMRRKHHSINLNILNIVLTLTHGLQPT
jgi:hypothetical protein